jgi:hypothetical protein
MILDLQPANLKSFATDLHRFARIGIKKSVNIREIGGKVCAFGAFRLQI